jgi:hypothetical protein
MAGNWLVDRRNIGPIFNEDAGNKFSVYCGEAIAKYDILAIKGMNGAYPAVYKCDPTDPTLSTNTIMGVAMYAGVIDTVEPLFVPYILEKDVDTSGAAAVGSRVFAAASGGWAVTGTLPVGVVVAKDATAGIVALAPALVEGVSGSQIVINDAASYWGIDTVQGALDALVLQLGGDTDATKAFTDQAVLDDDDPIYDALDKLDRTYEDLFRMMADSAATPRATRAKGMVLGSGNELLVEAQAVPDMTTRIQLGGRAWSHLGHKRSSAAAPIITHSASDPVNDREDIVVLTDADTIVVREGTPAGSPVDPTLTAGDVPLARVTVGGAAVALAGGVITDLRHRGGVLAAEETTYDDAGGYYAVVTDGPKKVDEVLNEIGLFARRLSPGHTFRVLEDFDFPAGSTLPARFTTQDTSAAGAPTLDYVSDELCGAFELTHDNINEVQDLTLYQGDNFSLEAGELNIVAFRVKLDEDTSQALAAGDRLVVGVASARNATLDNIVTNAWFRLEGDGASREWLYESDDGTTDDDDNASGVDYVDGTYVVLAIDFTNLAAVEFTIDGGVVGTTDMSALTTEQVQLFIELQRAANTKQTSVVTDLAYAAVTR